MIRHCLQQRLRSIKHVSLIFYSFNYRRAYEMLEFCCFFFFVHNIIIISQIIIECIYQLYDIRTPRPYIIIRFNDKILLFMYGFVIACDREYFTLKDVLSRRRKKNVNSVSSHLYAFSARSTRVIM